MKKPAGKKSTGTFTGSSGPKLTSAQKIAKYKSEAAKARKEAAKARLESAKARRESRKAAAEVNKKLAEAAHATTEAGKAIAQEAIDLRKKNPAGATYEAARAERDLAKAARYRAAAEHDRAKVQRDDARAVRDLARSRRDDARSARDLAKARGVGLASPVAAADGGWILGGNDWHRGCAAVAVSNGLLAATGTRVTDEDVLLLYAATTGNQDTGAGVEATLSTAETLGIGKCFPAGRNLAGKHAGVLVELALTVAQRDQDVWDWEPAPLWGVHAALLLDGHVITWGRAVPVTTAFLAGQVTGAWCVDWT